jgi:hypothetical protein
MPINYLAVNQLLVSTSPPTSHIGTNHRCRALPSKKAPIKRVRPSCTLSFARISLKQSMRAGRRRVSHGSSTIPRPGRDSERSTSLGGQAWWSRSWLCLT